MYNNNSDIKLTKNYTKCISLVVSVSRGTPSIYCEMLGFRGKPIEKH